MTVIFERVDLAADADFAFNVARASLPEKPDDDTMRVITMTPTRARAEVADFIFEVHEPSPTPQRVRVFKCVYGSVLREER